MPVFDFVMLLFAGVFAGFINTVAAGGSLITLPLLIFMGLPPAVANGTNRIAIAFQNVTATFSFYRKGISVFRTVFGWQFLHCWVRLLAQKWLLKFLGICLIAFCR